MKKASHVMTNFLFCASWSRHNLKSDGEHWTITFKMREQYSKLDNFDCGCGTVLNVNNNDIFIALFRHFSFNAGLGRGAVRCLRAVRLSRKTSLPSFWTFWLRFIPIPFLGYKCNKSWCGKIRPSADAMQ